MAIFHLTAKVISRGKGQSAIAAAAYRSGEKLFDQQAGEQKAYHSRSERITFTDIMAPGDAPEWVHDRNTLWNKAERAEKRKDAQLAREVEVSLPHELTGQQREWLVKDFAREAFVRKGYVVDIAIHAPDHDSDTRNHHAHLMVTRRTIGPEGFAATKDWRFDKTQLQGWRQQWAHLANRHLERYGHEARIDHRSLIDQGIDRKEREPTLHIGYAANEMAQRGVPSDRMTALNEILARNGLRFDLKVNQAEIDNLEKQAAVELQQQAAQGQREAEAERSRRPVSDDPLDWTDRAGMVAQQESAMRALRNQAGKRAEVKPDRSEDANAKAERLARLKKMFEPKDDDGRGFDPDDGHQPTRGGRERTR